HIWFTLYAPAPHHLKELVLHMYWDGERTPSVEAPLGDFFGLGLGDYFTWESELLSVANDRALNSFFPMPFQKHARITVTNQWQLNSDRLVEEKKNLNGDGNYVWAEATGRGHFLGVTMSVLQNQDGWWGEGDDMFFINGELRPSINGTGSEDYFLGAFDFGRSSFSYRLFGAPVKGEERAGGRSSVYRFHLDSPIPFSKSLRSTIEH